MKHTKKSSLLAPTLFAAMTLATTSVLAAANTTIVVTPDNPDGWTFSNTDNSGTNASGAFVVGPGTPPLGIGSANLTVGDATSSEILVDAFSGPTALTTFSTLTYSTYVTTSTPGSGSAPTLQFDLFNGTTYEGRLVFDPGLSFPVTDDTWQTWDAATTTTAAWYFTHNNNNTLSSDCSISSSTQYCTFDQALSFLSNTGIDAVDVLFKAGSGQASFDGNVDAFVIGDVDRTTTFDFEPTPEPASLALLGAGLAGIGAIRRRRR